MGLEAISSLVKGGWEGGERKALARDLNPTGGNLKPKPYTWRKWVKVVADPGGGREAGASLRGG